MKIRLITATPEFENDLGDVLRLFYGDVDFVTDAPEQTVTHTAREENGELFIEVADNGVGMPAAQRDELNRRLFGITMNAQQHIGLLNVNHRLKLIYGMNNAGLRIESTEGEGTRVLIRYGREHGALRSR